MSPEDRRPPFFRSGPKRPPPEHGIKAKAAGQTWWGLRWIEALERMAPEYALRLERGRTYARAGRTHDLTVSAGVVTAKVTGSRAQPYDVELKVSQLSAAAWEAAIESMAAKAQFAAQLLAGEMPRAIDEAFETANTSLFPAKPSELVTKCSCPDYANPCKHVAATHYVLGEALDRDPFLLFELRGKTKQEVLAALRAARSGGAEAPEAGTTEPGVISAMRVETISAADYDAPRAPLPSLHLEFDSPKAHAALLQQLGKPAAWSGDQAPSDLLRPIVQAAAERARSIALAEPDARPSSESEAAMAPSVKPAQPQPPAERADLRRKKRDALSKAAARARENTKAQAVESASANRKRSGSKQSNTTPRSAKRPRNPAR